jgi:prepilin-type processing-associated H-X9-DG protein
VDLREIIGDFKLRDLIVAVVLLGLLVGLLVPGLLHLRTGASTVECQNNLQQIGKACQEAQTEHGALPPYDNRAVGDASRYAFDKWNYGSQFFALLPFTRWHSTYEAAGYPGPQSQAYAVTVEKGTTPPVNFERGPPPVLLDYTNPPAIDMVLAKVIRGFICPSDPSAQAVPALAPNSWGGASYGGNFLAFANPHPVTIDDPDGLGGSGTLGVWANCAVVPLSFSKGASTTVLAAEKYLACGNGTPPGMNTRGTAWAWPNHQSSFAPAVAMESPWNDGTRFQVLPAPAECVSQYAQTGHAAGMNVLMADGSGRALEKGISANVYQRMMEVEDRR